MFEQLFIYTFILFAFYQSFTESCMTESYAYIKREQHNSHVFVKEEYQPSGLNEKSIDASGPFSDNMIVSNKKKLFQLKYKEIIFADKNAQFMTRNCAEKVENLAMLIYNAWGGNVKLKIQSAWIPYNKHNSKAIDDLHYAGRAVDMILVKIAYKGLDANNGKLAEIAYYRASFDWCKYTDNEVHCSVKPEDTPRVSHFACFPGSSKVVVQNEFTSAKLSTLHPGQSVLAMSDYMKFIFSPVLTYMHREPTLIQNYIELTTANKSLRLSDNHLLYTKKGNSIFTLYAKDVNNGDYILLKDLQPEKIRSLKTVRDVGAFAPLTKSGTIVVDGVVVSCYAYISSTKIAHALHYPLRFFYEIGWRQIGMNYHERLHWYSNTLLSFAKYALPTSFLSTT